jgi:O-antigen/teichoic acid export membrane protein
MSSVFVLLLTAGLTWLLPIAFGARLGVGVDLARWTIALLGAAVAVQMAFNAFGGVLTGCHRWDIHNTINSAAYALILVGMIAALQLGGGLRALSVVYLAGTVVGEVTRMLFAYRICPELQVSPRLATWEDIKMLLSFGGKTVVDNMSRLVLAQANSLLVVSYLGPAALAVYARPGALARHADTLTNKFAFVLAPAASSLESTRQDAELRDLFIDATRFAVFLAMPVTVFLAIMGDPILQVWMGPRYGSGALMAVMALGCFLPLTQRPAGHVMIGLNAHGVVGWASFVVAWVGVAAAVFALGPLHAGLVGAALALVIPYSLGDGLFVMIYACRRVGVPLRHYCRNAFAAPLACAIPLAVGLGIVRVVCRQQPLLALAAGAAVSALVLAPLYWRFMLPESARATIAARLQRVAAPALAWARS